MNLYSKLQNRLAVIIIIIFVIGLVSCNKDDTAKNDVPAKVDNPVKESSLTTVTLSEMAEKRLGIETALAESKNIPAVLKSSAEIIAIPGRNVLVSAPVAGTILYSNNVQNSLAGRTVKKGQEVMRLLLMPPEKDALNAREEVSVKEIEYNVALAKTQRAEQLYKDKAISEKLLQEAQAALAAAKGALNGAKARLSLLDGAVLDSTNSDFSAMILEAPYNGVLQQILIASGQKVAAATPLFEVAALNPLWLRVSVYVGDLTKIDRSADILISPLGDNPNEIEIKAKPVNGPPLSDPVIASSDLYYELMNERGKFRIGQKVMAFLPLISTERNVIIPSSAVIYDMYGGSWVYVKKAPLTYQRHRVEISHTPDSFSVITRGLGAGEEIAITAVAELYGTEFGGGK